MPDNVKSLWWVENDRISDLFILTENTIFMGIPYNRAMDGLKFRISPNRFSSRIQKRQSCNKKEKVN
jgi:hypothetical protein